MPEREHDLLEALEAIDPSACSYEEWAQIGMALKHEGHQVADWESWSRRDGARYHEGECAKKWQSFRGSGSPITGGTIVALARAHGWRPPVGEGYELSWDDIIGPRDEQVVVRDAAWVEAEDVPEPEAWDPVRELTTYLETLFEAGENVGYVAQSWEKDGRYLPQKGNWDRTAGELIQSLGKHHSDIKAVIGDYNPDAGAWIRFNPLDGQGCKNDNVTEFRYALVESDLMEIGKQLAIIKAMELPVACLVHSGKKSLHAIVRVDAADYDEYRKRVDYLYAACKKNGLAVDAQNKNPSRLSRMPGIMRGDRKQFLVATNIGKESWVEWQSWLEASTDELPEPERLSDVWGNLPPLDPPIIDGLLRRGHKMLLSGGPKDGKSFALIELAIAIAEGREWLGWQCAQGRVLYVNLEVAKPSFLHRVFGVYTALGWKPCGLDDLVIWNLRGKAVSVDQLMPKLIRRAAGQDYSAIIIDPIYKIAGGDENSAADMARFCNQLDVVARELGCAVIYCHHHSKGSQGQKRSMDRASGSGVFARDADALIDFIRLDLSKNLIEQQVNDAECVHLRAWLAEHRPDGHDGDIGPDTQASSSAFRSALAAILPQEQMNALIGELEGVKKTVRAYKALRIEGTLREFIPFSPVDVWFKHPIHELDSVGVLADVKSDGEQPVWEKAAEARKASAGKARDKAHHELEEAIEKVNFGEPPTKKQVAEYLGIALRTLNDRIKSHGGFIIDRDAGNVIIPKDSQ